MGGFSFDFSYVLDLFYNFVDTTTYFLGNFFRIFHTMGSFIRDLFRTIWEKFIKNGLLKVLHLLAKLRAWAERIFGPILRLLRKIRDWLDKVYYPRLLKILNMIQRVRAMLTIFRIFNVTWAKRLDERLLRLETKIAEPYLRLRAFLNEIATVINLVLDPSLIFHRNVLLASILSHLGVVRRALGYGRARQFTSLEEVQAERERTRYEADNVREHVRVLASSGLTDQDKAMRAKAREALERVTGGALAF